MIGCRFLQIGLALGIFAVPCSAQVQPGSTGGSIGKTDKSASGEERQASSSARSTSNASKRAEDNGGCGRITGTWKWSNNIDVVVKSNRTADATDGGHARLNCDSGMYVFNWQGGRNVSRMTLGADGKRLSGMGFFGAESAVRK